MSNRSNFLVALVLLISGHAFAATATVKLTSDGQAAGGFLRDKCGMAEQAAKNDVVDQCTHDYDQGKMVGDFDCRQIDEAHGYVGSCQERCTITCEYRN